MTNVDLIKAGLALVPIPIGKKSPIHTEWNTLTNCITQIDHLYILEGQNVGLAHAYCSPTPTCALDIDHYPSAKEWLVTRGLDINEFLFAIDAVVIWSGKKYSLKLLYRLPAGLPPLESKRVNSQDGHCALEFRCASKDGKTVQDVLPPSIHPDGHEYRWCGGGDPCKLAEIPVRLLEVWQALTVDRARKLRCDITAIPKRLETPRQIAMVRDMLSHIDADCPYDYWRNIIWSVLSTGWQCAEELAQAWSMTAPTRYDEEAFWRIANSYIPEQSSPITLGSLYYHARKGGWNG